MKHLSGCPRLMFWDVGEQDAPCLCYAMTGKKEPLAKPAILQFIILRNRARCIRCQDVIESKHTHDFTRCACGSIAVDGGKDYIRRIGELEALEELSEFKEL